MKMDIQLPTHYQHLHIIPSATHQQQVSLFLSSSSSYSSPYFINTNKTHNGHNTLFVAERPIGFSNYVHKPIQTRRRRRRRRRRGLCIAASSSSSADSPLWDGWVPVQGSKVPSLSDIIWPSAGAFAAMAVLGKMDQMLAPKGLSMTIAPLGAVSAVLFAAPSSPAARKYNMFMAQIGCAAIGVLALTIFGPGWLARSTGLAAAVAFMIYTHCLHPPAASLPLLFIDGAKLHHLNFWYAFFPGATGCILLCIIQEVVCYLKDNFKF